MKNAMTKSTLREIKGSFSRWIAILAICALGVSFFSGLKVCKEAFHLTGDTFLSENNFFDYQLISTLGLEEKDISKIEKIQGVKGAYGSYSQDVLFTIGDSHEGEKVARVLTLLDNINIPDLREGVLPSKANECVADFRYFTSSDIGKEILLSSNNDKDTKDMFAYKRYKIVGLCESPLYLNFERGSTSLGDGSVAGYFYIPPAGWDSEVFTEIYVSMKKTGFIYSEEYKDNAKALKEPLTAVLETCANSRYDEILAEANEKLADAEKELNEGKQELADAERELADGEKKLTDGRLELKENEEKLADSRKLLDKSKADYEKGLDDYNSQKETAYATLEEQKIQLDTLASTPYYDQYFAQFQQAKAKVDSEFEAAWQTLESARQKLEKGEKDYADGLVKLEDGKKELIKSEKKLIDGRKEIQDGKKEIAEAEEKLDDARDEIEDIENPKTYVLGRDSNIGYVCFENDTGIVDSIAKVFPVFFFLVAALVCMTTMTRMIDEQRTQIGVLKALGYGKGRILLKYVFYAGSASLMGSVIGFFGGSYLFPAVIWSAYNMMYDFADLIFVLNWKLGILSVAAAILCCVGTTIFCCYAELFNVPAELIRPKAPALGKRILLERVTFIWSKLKFLHKVCLRNIFRYKKRFFMMVLGICGCTALLITAMGISDSIKNVVGAQYDQIFHNDYSVVFDKDISEAEKEEFLLENKEYIDKVLFLDTISVDAHVGDKIKSVNMIVCNQNDPIRTFIDLHNDKGSIDFPKKDYCVINDNLALNLGLSIGDELTVFDGDMREMTMTIEDLCDNYVNNYIYINNETYQEQWGEVETNSAFVIGPAGSDGRVENPHEKGAKLMDADNVASVSITQDMRERISNMMKSLDYVIILVMVCAGALAFIVLYNLTNINITERIREIATLEVLGFYANETNAYVFRENVVLTAISALVGIPVGIGLHGFVMDQVKIDLLSFDIHIDLSSYLIAVVMTFGFTLIVNFAMYFRLKKINMAESLKSIE